MFECYFRYKSQNERVAWVEEEYCYDWWSNSRDKDPKGGKIDLIRDLVEFEFW